MNRNKMNNPDYSWKRAGVLLALMTTIFLVTACQKTGASPTPYVGITDIQITNLPKSLSPTLEPYPFKTSQPGNATLHGNLVVLDPSTLPDQNDAIFLVPIDQSNVGVLTIPQFTKGEVPQAEVDERSGEFMFTDIKVGRYVVVVLTAGGAQIPARTMDGSRGLVVVNVDDTFLNKITEIGKMSLP